jgi:predicted transcriptional regulator
MSKAVLISIQPKWCELIASGKKMVEVRKTKPKIETPFKCYIYETQGRTETPWVDEEGHEIFKGRGQVIGEFVCDAIFPMSIWYSNPNDRLSRREYPYTCLTDKEIMDYLGNGVEGYGWHISDLVLYDMPRALRGFYHYCGDNPNCDGCELLYYSNTECGKEEFCCSNMYGCKPLKRPPQSWCYVEEVEE